MSYPVTLTTGPFKLKIDFSFNTDIISDETLNDFGASLTITHLPVLLTELVIVS